MGWRGMRIEIEEEEPVGGNVEARLVESGMEGDGKGLDVVLGKMLLSLNPFLKQSGREISVTVTSDGEVAIVMKRGDKKMVYVMHPEQASTFFARALMLAEFLCAMRERRELLQMRGLPDRIDWKRVREEVVKKR